MDIVRDAVVQMMMHHDEMPCDCRIIEQGREVDHIATGHGWISFYVMLVPSDSDRKRLRSWFDDVAMQFTTMFDDLHVEYRYYGIEVIGIDRKSVLLRRIRFV